MLMTLARGKYDLLEDGEGRLIGTLIVVCNSGGAIGRLENVGSRTFH